jgi:PhzF family phenazine biosynthesis protein
VFLQTPKDTRAAYRLRIFSPKAELPFAGHPSVGTAFAAIDAGLVAAEAAEIVQECGVGLVRLTVEGKGDDRIVFVTSPEPRVETATSPGPDAICRAMAQQSDDNLSHSIVDVGPRWLTVQLETEGRLRSLSPDFPALTQLSEEFSLTGLTAYALSDDSRYQVAVRSFAPAHGIPEDPVCGSGNVSVAAHLNHTDGLTITGSHYVANQGRELGRDGYVTVRVSEDGRSISVGGRAKIRVSGTIMDTGPD